MTSPPAPTAPAPLPGARTSCALLTMLTVLLAWPDPPEALAVLVRPGYFAFLTWFFWRTGRASPALDKQPMRLVQGGFAVLWLGFMLSAVIWFAGLDHEHDAFGYLRDTCERGGLVLLGTTLISYGLMLWIPRVLHSHRLLADHSARQQGALRVAEHTRSELEQRLVDADRRGMLGEIAASVAHDLRNPLTIVKGTAESLCRRPRTPAEVAEHTDVIRRNVDKADRAMAALIDLARPRTIAVTDLAAGELLREVEALLRVEARRQGITLTTGRIDGSGTPCVRGDRTLLAQALINLALNAVQATPRGGSVRLRARARGAHVAFVVEDRGTGLPPEVRARLFTPFFTTKATGTGLGLSSCRRIATELGGVLRLYPRTRGGARAVLLLPAAGNPGGALRSSAAAADENGAWLATSC